MWSSVLGDVEFKIKFFELGLKPNTTIKGTQAMVTEIEKKCSELYSEYRKIYPIELLPIK